MNRLVAQSTFLLFVVLAFPSLTLAEEFSAAARQAALRKTGRVTDHGNGVGSCVFLGKFGGYSFAITANHVVGRAQSITVETFGPSSDRFRAQLHTRWEERDLALLRFDEKQWVPGIAQVCPIKDVPALSSHVLTTGCDGGAPPTVHTATIGAKADHYWIVREPMAKGRSGGGLFDSSGRLAGITSLGDSNTGYYIHLDYIHRLLDMGGLKKPDPPVPDRPAAREISRLVPRQPLPGLTPYAPSVPPRWPPPYVPSRPIVIIIIPVPVYPAYPGYPRYPYRVGP